MIRLRLCPSVRSLCGAPILFAAAMLAITPVRAERAPQPVSPFAAMVGTWSGNGTVSLTNGSSERIRCQAAYAIGDASNNLRSVLRCASDSYKFELNSDVNSRAGALTGAWREATRGLTGGMSGTFNGKDVRARIESPGFSADLMLETNGNSQTVTLRSQGTELTGVAITLSRR